MIRHYWREALFALTVTLPLLALAPLGFWWLREQGWVVWWAAGAALAGLVAMGLRLSIRRAATGASAHLADIAPASPDWGPREQAAWALVEQHAADAEPLSADNWPALRERLEGTVDLVARHFHPGTEAARWKITLPEALLLSERISRDLRRVCQTYLPGADHLQLAHVFWAKDWYDRHGETAKTAFDIAMTAKRVGGLALNPAAALLSELKDRLAGEVVGHLTDRLRRDMAQLLVRETGRAAIDLYAGRLRLDAQQAQTLADATPRGPADLVAPIQVLITGQVSAGKSSLLNALADKAQRQVGVAPTRDGPATLHLQRDGKPELVLTDLPGIGLDGRGERELGARIDTADLLVWVVSATEPARAADVAQLDHLRQRFANQPDRRFPPLLVVVTHIDQLRPQREWDPPYDLLTADRPKAQSIRAVIEHVAQTLTVEPDQVVPVMVRTLEQGYNLELVWDLIASNTDAARFTHLDRLHRQAGEFSLSRTAQQAARAGAFLVRQMMGQGR